MAKKISPNILPCLLRYEAETGELFWLQRDSTQRRWNSRWAGKPAFTALCGNGYRQGHLFGEKVLAHRVAWAIHYGEWPNIIDHINGVRADNRICNLRNVSAAENNLNLAIRRENTSGVIGVRWTKGAWQASITVAGNRKYLGRFSDLSDALAARKLAEVDLGFHPNHGRAA